MLRAASHIDLNPRTTLAEGETEAPAQTLPMHYTAFTSSGLALLSTAPRGLSLALSVTSLEGPPPLDVSSAHLPRFKPSQRSVSSRKPF